MPTVKLNLWEALTKLARLDKTLNEAITHEALVFMTQASAARSKFGSEIEAEIDECGNWTLCVFSHEDSDTFVRLKVNPHGDVTVTRGRETKGIQDQRTISF